jgi:hypothetical protein
MLFQISRCGGLITFLVLGMCAGPDFARAEINGRAGVALLFEHDLFGKPVSTHRVVARGHAFPDHALDDMEVGGVQLRLENAVQGDGVMAIDGDDRVAMAVVMHSVQGG